MEWYEFSSSHSAKCVNFGVGKFGTVTFLMNLCEGCYKKCNRWLHVRVPK
jgi:hypothetical protein